MSNLTNESLKMQNVPLVKPEFPRFIKTTSPDSSTTFQVNKIDSILPDSSEGFLKQALGGAKVSLPLESNMHPYYFILDNQDQPSPFATSPLSPQSKIYFKSGGYDTSSPDNSSPLSRLSREPDCKSCNINRDDSKSDNHFPILSRTSTKFFAVNSQNNPAEKSQTYSNSTFLKSLHSSVESLNPIAPPLNSTASDHEKFKEESGSTKSQQKKHHFMFNWNIGKMFTKTDAPIQTEIDLAKSSEPPSGALTDIIDGYFISPRSELHTPAIVTGNDIDINPKKSRIDGEGNKIPKRKIERRRSFSILSGRFRKHKEKEKGDWSMRELKTAEAKLFDSYSNKFRDDDQQLETTLLVKNKNEGLEKVSIETRLILVENQTLQDDSGEELRCWVKDDLIKIIQDGKLRLYRDANGRTFITIDVTKSPPLAF